jgi:nitrite reductase (NO-forming)
MTARNRRSVQGKLNFEMKCLACHSIAGGDKLGPDLHHVTARRAEAWLQSWLKNPEVMLQSDPAAKQLLAKYTIPMPNQNLSDDEIKTYIAYFKWADRNLRPQGQAQPPPAAPGAARGPAETYSAPRPGTRRWPRAYDPTRASRIVRLRCISAA